MEGESGVKGGAWHTHTLEMKEQTELTNKTVNKKKKKSIIIYVDVKSEYKNNTKDTAGRRRTSQLGGGGLDVVHSVGHPQLPEGLGGFVLGKRARTRIR